MHRLAYLLPPIALFAHWVWVNQGGGGAYHVDYQIYAVALVAAEGAVGLAHYLARRAGLDTEFLSGYVTEVRYYRAWTERVVYYETISDGKGNTRQVQRVRFVEHPPYWQWGLNTGHVENISQAVYQQLVWLWGGSTSYFSTFHANCVAGGGGEMCVWDQNVEHMQTQTYPHRYNNPLDRSNSIFRYEEISRQEASEMGLYDYPAIHNYEQQPIVGLDIATEADQRAFQLLNATMGNSCQVHFFVLIYDASKGLTIGEKQRAYWHGGNKNEFTICLGVEHPRVSDSSDSIEEDPYVLKWCNAFSWMDEPQMELALESWARDHEGEPLNLQQFANWLRENIKLWQRKEWKDFKYIANPMTWWQLLIVFGTALIACGVAWYAMLNVK